MLRKTASVEVSVKVEQTELMAAPQRSISKYARPNMAGATSSIAQPPIASNNFGLSPNFIQMFQQMYQFDRFQDEDPYAHLTKFLEICDAFKANKVPKNAIHLQPSPFVVRGKAK